MNQCPFKGCGKTFAVGWLGLDAHWKSGKVGHNDSETYPQMKARVFGESGRATRRKGGAAGPSKSRGARKKK